MSFITNWREAWKWFSVQFLAIIAIIPIVWATLPPEAHAMIPAEWRPWLVGALALAGIVGRLVDQSKAEV
jgi:di/tricarboxylate transporter